MFEVFETYITTEAHFTREELKHMRSLSVIKKLRRKQFLLQEGEICRHKVFVTKGLLRTYRLKDDGTEYIIRFAPENTWTLEHESFNTQKPTRYNIDALEDTELVTWTRENFDELLNSIPALRSFSEKLKTNTLSASQERILMNISYTSEEKYQDFIDSYPDIFRRIPLHMVASYLGVSRETLSRIRHAQQKPQKNNGIG